MEKSGDLSAGGKYAKSPALQEKTGHKNPPRQELGGGFFLKLKWFSAYT